MKIKVEETSLGRVNLGLRVIGAEKITPLLLIEVSELCFDLYKSLDVGTDKSFFYHMGKAAEAVVNWGECPEEGVDGIGPFMAENVFIPKAGDQVRVKRDSKVRSTHPQVPIEGRLQKRSQKITVRSVSNGFVDVHDLHRYGIRSPEVTWAGTGGYWNRVALWDIEPAE